MPSPERSHRRQDAVLWTLASHDEEGENTVNSPVELRVRWEEVFEEVLNRKGDPVALDAKVMVDREIEIGSLMYKGTLDDWYGVGSAGDEIKLMEVITYTDLKDIKGRVSYRSVGLCKYRDTLPTIV